MKVSFWTPNRMVDVVTEPGCMMALGVDIMPTGGKLQGSQSSISDGTNTTKLFAQMHYYQAPVWKMRPCRCAASTTIRPSARAAAVSAVSA